MTTNQHDEQPHHGTPDDDRWFSHESDAEAPQEAHGRIHATKLMAWLVGMFVVIFATSILLVWFFGQERQRALRMRHEINIGGATRALLDQGRAELNAYAWVDAEAGVVQAPIDVAMQRVVRMYQEEAAAR